MPEPLHPPYVSTQQPRQLDRWLDVNSQNGPLTRVRGYFQIPSFNAINNVWLGFSHILARIEYSSPNSFSFIKLPDFSNLNFFFCISWLDSNNVNHRYTLNGNVGEVIYFDTVPYTNQVIPKNFRLEIWSTYPGHTEYPVNLTPITIYTSKLGIVDYRFGTDFLLFPVNNFNTKLWQQNTNMDGSFPLPLVFNMPWTP